MAEGAWAGFSPPDTPAVLPPHTTNLARSAGTNGKVRGVGLPREVGDAQVGEVVVEYKLVGQVRRLLDVCDRVEGGQGGRIMHILNGTVYPLLSFCRAERELSTPSL